MATRRERRLAELQALRRSDPVALLALLLYPFVWLVLLPFRLLGIAVEGVFAFLKAVVFLPARVLGGR